MKDTTIIIRSVGERTTPVCEKILQEYFPEIKIHIISEAPFSKAIEKCFQLGIREQKKWTLCIDADVLPQKGSLETLVNLAEEQPAHIFEFQGLILDKFIPIKRPAGNHLYRTSLLQKAIGLIPHGSGVLRPETDMLNRMGSLGYPFLQTNILIGIHDFFQFYEDIYRKCFVQAHKHKSVLLQIESFWRKMKNEDKDFRAALLGALSGTVHEGDIEIDKEMVIEEARFVLQLKSIKEKAVIISEEFSPETINQLVQSFEINQNIQDKLFPEKRWKEINGIPQSSMNRIIRRLIKFLGNKIIRVGEFVNSVAERI